MNQYPWSNGKFDQENKRNDVSEQSYNKKKNVSPVKENIKTL